MNEVEKHYGSEGSPRRPDDLGPGTYVPGHSFENDGKSAGPKAADMAGKARDAVTGAVAQARDWSRETLDDASTWASETYESASRRATYARRKSAVHIKGSYRTVEDFVEENPVMVGVAGLAAGLLIGSLLPGTRRENRYIGPYADELREQGVRYAQNVAEQGRQAVQDNLSKVAQGVRGHDDPMP